MKKYHVVVIGGGNAAYSAALEASEVGADVLVLEKASQNWAGGNSFFTAAAFRAAINSMAEVRTIVDDLDEQLASRTVLPPYPVSAFIEDVRRVTHSRNDPELTEVVASESVDALRWLRRLGHRFELLYSRQAVEVEGKWRFAGGLYLGVRGEGPALVAGHRAAAERRGVETRFDAEVTSVERVAKGDVRFEVVYRTPEGEVRVPTGAVVIASGGFQADPTMRASYLGPGWDLAKVRGTPHNTGDGHRIGLALGAQPAGHWSGAHAVPWEASSRSEHGDREARHLLTKQSYWLGILVNTQGRRFIDEGSDLRAYTYATIGAEILKQPGAVAYQIFDAQTRPLLRQTEYGRAAAGALTAGSITELAEMVGVSAATLNETVEEFNAATEPGEFDPSRRDGLSTTELTPPKSNWALALREPPFHAYPVTCGITFTFGGLRIDRDGAVLGRRGQPIGGLYAAGEIVGGIFYHNYPGGSGLTAGTVFGRRAGRAASAWSQRPASGRQPAGRTY